MSKFINPFTDIGFKRIFGQEVSKPVLLAFLNSLLEGERNIVDLKFLDKEQLGISDGDRSLIYDVYCETIFEKIIYTLKHMDILERMPWMAQNAVFQRLSEIAEVASLTKEERIKYDAGLKAYRDTLAVMDGQYELGEQKGFIEGHAEGLVKGRAEGLVKGQEEANRENARKMKSLGMSADIIAQVTGLSVEEQAEL